MLKIVALPDLHGHTSHFKKFSDVLADADIVILAGDLTNGSITTAQTILTAIRQYNQNVLAVPGNMDHNNVPQFLSDEGINIHETHCIIDGVAILGVGGALPFYGRFVFNEEQLEQIAEATLKNLPPNTQTVLISHQPPYNTLNDAIDNGSHVGSHSIRKFIETVQPLVCFTGHIHEAVGIDTIGKTKIINPGPLGRHKSYAYAEIEHGTLELIEIRKV